MRKAGHKQTAENSSGEPAVNPFENKQPVKKDIAQSKEAVNKEQQFKKAQTERD